MFGLNHDQAEAYIDSNKVKDQELQEHILSVLATKFSTCNFTSLVKSTTVPYRKRWRKSHDEDNNCESVEAYFNDMYHNYFDTNLLNNVPVHLPLFFSAKSVPLTVEEEARNILLLSAKYHTKADGMLLIFLPIL